jgi:hypothetical protein
MEKTKQQAMNAKQKFLLKWTALGGPPLLEGRVTVVRRGVLLGTDYAFVNGATRVAFRIVRPGRSISAADVDDLARVGWKFIQIKSRMLTTKNIEQWIKLCQ